jgi:hypothetical protein
VYVAERDEHHERARSAGAVRLRQPLPRRETHERGSIGSRVSKVLAIALVLAAACETPPAFDRDRAREIIEHSVAFKSSWDPAMRIEGAPPSPDPSWHREFLEVRGVEVRGSGVSAVARVGFTWRWNAGPFEGSTFKGTALLLSVGPNWQLQEEKLQNEIWKQERHAE